MVIQTRLMQWRLRAPRPLRERGGGEGAACPSRGLHPLIELLAIRRSPQAGKSLVIPNPLPSREREFCGATIPRKLGICLLALLTLLLPALCNAQLVAELDKKIASMGEPLNLRITSTSNLSELDLTPLKNDFEVFSQASSSSTRNGREQSVLDVTLYPLHSGKLSLPSLALGHAHSRPLAVEIQPSPVSLRTLLTPSVPMEREPAILHLEIRDDGSLNWAIPRQIDAPHITLQALPEQMREEQHDGATSIVHDYRWRVLPLKGESLSIRFGMLDANKFGQRLRFPLPDVSFRVQAAPAYLPLYLPIGKPILRTETLPKQIIAGQPVAWNMDIQAPGLSAEGALKLLQYDTPRGLRFYAPSVTPITRDGIDALRLTLTFVAEHDAQIFPALHLAYYDPKLQRIEALTIPAARFSVRDPLRERIMIAALLISGVLLLTWLGYKTRPWLRRLQTKRAWLARIQAAQDVASLYRALTQDAPWQATTLEYWPSALHIDPILRAQLEQARFGPLQGEIQFADLKREWLSVCAQLPLRNFGP